jgi:hypothetical protein
MSQGYTKSNPIDTDGTLSANSDFLLPSQKAVKTYVDTEINAENLQTIYDKSTPTAEIVTDATRGAVTVQAGVSDTNTVIEAKNIADTVTASISGAGLVTSTARVKNQTQTELTSTSYNDYDIGNASDILFTTTNTTTTITGFASGSINGRELTISNNNSGSTNIIIIKNQDASSLAQNRVQSFDDIVLAPGEKVTFRWRVGVNVLSRWGVVSITRSTRKFIPETPAQITSNQNNYSTLGYDVLRLSTDASREITGFANGLRGKMLIINNVGSFNIVLKHQNASSTASNRMILGNAGVDVTILPNDSVTLLYDTTDSRWRLISKSF